MKVILLAVAVVTLAVGLFLCSVGISEAFGARTNKGCGTLFFLYPAMVFSGVSVVSTLLARATVAKASDNDFFWNGFAVLGGSVLVAAVIAAFLNGDSCRLTI